MSYNLKLSRPGGETRRVTFSRQPKWSELEDKVASLFDVPRNAVAVSYEDSDGDIVTMSSQEEAQDYFRSVYKVGDTAKLVVVDKVQSQRPRAGSAAEFYDGVDEDVVDGMPTVGPTMVFEVEDGGWQRLPRIPEMFEDEQSLPDPETHAFVEVVESDTAPSRNASTPLEHSPNGLGSRQLRHKGKQRASPRTNTSRLTSEASIVDDEIPIKPDIHVRDVSDSGRSPQGSTQGLPGQTTYSGPGVENLMGSFGTVYPASPPHDAFKGVPRPSAFINIADRNAFEPSITSARSESAHSVQPMPDRIPSIDLEDNMGPNETAGSRTPTLGQTSLRQPSFVHDVANLVDNLTEAFASHPELSEGLQNIVRNAVGGTYWNSERDRIAIASENVRMAAEETSQRISQVAGNMANSAEREAVRTIADALGGVFRVIGELSGAGLSESSRTQYAAPQGPPPSQPHDRAFAPPPGPPPHHRHEHRGSSDRGPPPRTQDGPGGGAHRYEDHPHRGHHGHNHEPSRHGARGFDNSRSWREANPPQQGNTWAQGTYAPHYLGGSSYDNSSGESGHPNVHQTKATLEAAKAVYKAEKERFRKEKEQRRRMKHETEARRADQGRTMYPDGTTREEEIIARLPYQEYSRNSGPSKQQYSDIYTTQPRSSGATAGRNTLPRSPSAQVAPAVSSRPSGVDSSVYSAPDPIPPVPPAPIPAPASIMVPPPPPPPAPPAPPMTHALSAQYASLGSGPVNTSTPVRAPTLQASQSASGPIPWPNPPTNISNSRRALTTVRERIMARLFDMGITTASQPDMMDILNEITSRNDAPDDEEVLADVLSAMDIRSSPSPRGGPSNMRY